MNKKVLAGVLCCLSMFLELSASELSLKMYGGLGWLDGGDLNRNIQGWSDYYRDRNSAPYSFKYSLKEVHGLSESGAEFLYNISRRLRIGIGLGYLIKSRKGDMSWSLSQEQEYVRSPSDFGTIFLEGQLVQQPKYRLQAVPATLSIYYSFPLGQGIELSLEGGAGYTFAKLTYSENYEYNFDYRDDRNLFGSLSRYVDNYFSSGTYLETSTARAFGLQGGASLELKISGSSCLILEALGRWIDFKEWKGTKSDDYTWNHTWGFWGVSSDKGAEKETQDGKLWAVEFESSQTGKFYPRLVFSEGIPISSSYRNPRLARINLNGFSLRVGFKLSI